MDPARLPVILGTIVNGIKSQVALNSSCPTKFQSRTTSKITAPQRRNDTFAFVAALTMKSNQFTSSTVCPILKIKFAVSTATRNAFLLTANESKTKELSPIDPLVGELKIPALQPPLPPAYGMRSVLLSPWFMLASFTCPFSWGSVSWVLSCSGILFPPCSLGVATILCTPHLRFPRTLHSQSLRSLADFMPQPHLPSPSSQSGSPMDPCGRSHLWWEAESVMWWPPAWSAAMARVSRLEAKFPTSWSNCALVHPMWDHLLSSGSSAYVGRNDIIPDNVWININN